MRALPRSTGGAVTSCSEGWSPHPYALGRRQRVSASPSHPSRPTSQTPLPEPQFATACVAAIQPGGRIGLDVILDFKEQLTHVEVRLSPRSRRLQMSPSAKPC